MDLELEWYEGVRNGNNYLCDRCNERELNIDEFSYNIREIYNSSDYMRYCNGCRNWIELKNWRCNDCKISGTHRSETNFKICPNCRKEVILVVS